MNAQDVFSKISDMLLEGVMFHDQMADCFSFLGLDGFACEHEAQAIKEAAARREAVRYFIENHNQLLKDANSHNLEIIPDTWRKYARQQIDTATKRRAVRDAYDRWFKREKEAKEILETFYKELIEEAEVASATKIKDIICAVESELCGIVKKQLILQSTDYDIGCINSMQKRRAEMPK